MESSDYLLELFERYVEKESKRNIYRYINAYLNGDVSMCKELKEREEALKELNEKLLKKE